MKMKAILETTQLPDCLLAQSLRSRHRTWNAALYKKYRYTQARNTHTLTQIKVHKVEHQGHFTKTPFHLAFLLNKGSEMFNRAVRNLCLNIKKRSFFKKRRKFEKYVQF